MQQQQQIPRVLTMGLSPAAAVATWRLASSKLFQCSTYWPVESVVFQSEVFGETQVYRPDHFDLNDSTMISSLPGKAFSVVILVVPTIKDVVRMCRRLQPVISKNTLVLVDVSGGIAPLQRLVRTNLDSSVQVSGLICDIDAEFASKAGHEWTVVHRKLSGGSNSSKIITLEPNSGLAKVISTLETAWSVAGVPATHTKTSTAFGELQWQRTITVVAFELLTVALDFPDPEKLTSSLIAKPIIEGVVAELNMIAVASGIKGLPSKSQMVSRGTKLARRAPTSFSIPGASRLYYDTFRRTPIALDFLVLLPILLSDELPKGGATPYLESLYAYMSRLLELNNNEYTSALFQRTDQAAALGNASAQNGHAGPASVDPQVIAQLKQRSDALATQESQLQARESQFHTREADIKALEARCNQMMEDLRVQQEQHSAKSAELETQAAQHQRRLQSFEELNERSQKIRAREEQLSEMERKFGMKDRGLRQRELDLVNREQALIARESELLNNVSISNRNRSISGEDVMRTPALNSSVSPPNPTTPGGTVYSRFDPRAPPMNNNTNPIAQSGAAAGGQTPMMSRSRSSQMPPMNGGAMNGGLPMNGNVSGFNGEPMISRPGSRSQLSTNGSMQFYGGQPMMAGPVPNGGSNGPIPSQRRRQSRRMSADDNDVSHSRRRQHSMPNNLYSNPAATANSTLFSQNFQLDGVMGTATDRYHFVSRAHGKPRDTKLSSDEEAYTAHRKFVHGGPNAANTGAANGGAPTSSAASYAGSVHNIAVDIGGGAYPDAASRSFNPGDLSGSGSTNGMSQRRSVGGVSKMVNSATSRSLLPSSIVAGATSDFGGFTFGDTLDAAANSNGSTGSHNLSSSGSNGTPSRSRSGTPPTPQGTMDPTMLIPGQKWDAGSSAVPFRLS